MNSYAIYRIAETLRVLLFMTVSILVFNFYPVTAVMIVMLALLNDGAILSIAYDNVQYKDQPESWNMRMVLGISSVLGVIGVVAAFGLFYLGERVFHLDRLHVQTLMYLKLSVAGHLTIFLTRTRGPFWSIRPAKILWIAVLGTQVLATLMAVYGFLMAPLGWRWAGFVWGYALVWFLINDRLKLLAYRIFDPPQKGDAKSKVKLGSKAGDKAGAKPENEPDTKGESKPETKGDAKPEVKPGGKPDVKAESKPDAKPVTKPEVKAEAKPEDKPETKAEPKPEAKPESEAKPGVKAKTPSDLKPQIAKRAFEIFQKRNHQDDPAAQDWEQAETEIRKDEAKVEPKPDADTGADSTTEVGSKSGAEAGAKPEVKAEPKAEPKPEGDGGTHSGAKAKPPSDLTTGMVKRVHKLYETLGREDVKAVEDMEKTGRDSGEDETQK
jgi:H+-transporting ATPase